MSALYQKMRNTIQNTGDIQFVETEIQIFQTYVFLRNYCERATRRKAFISLANEPREI